MRTPSISTRLGGSKHTTRSVGATVTNNAAQAQRVACRVRGAGSVAGRRHARAARAVTVRRREGSKGRSAARGRRQQRKVRQ